MLQVPAPHPKAVPALERPEGRRKSTLNVPPKPETQVVAEVEAKNVKYVAAAEAI